MTARFHQIDITDILGGGWQAACTCGAPFETHHLTNDALSAAEARRDAQLHSIRHIYEVVCPTCHQETKAMPQAIEGGLRMTWHTRSMSDPYRPGQRCEGLRVLPVEAVQDA